MACNQGRYFAASGKFVFRVGSILQNQTDQIILDKIEAMGHVARASEYNDDTPDLSTKLYTVDIPS